VSALKRDLTFHNLRNWEIMNVMRSQSNNSFTVLTPHGKGEALAWLDFGKHSLWIVRLKAEGECWAYSNQEIRAEKAGNESNN
jgi:hypothetical protein